MFKMTLSFAMPIKDIISRECRDFRIGFDLRLCIGRHYSRDDDARQLRTADYALARRCSMNTLAPVRPPPRICALRVLACRRRYYRADAK